MCLGIPGRIVEIREGDGGIAMGRVDFGGVLKDACLAYAPEAAVGDYVIVHVGFAISRLDQAEADRVFSYLREMDELGELEAP